MKLVTKAIEKKVPALYEQDGKGMEAVAYAKYFYPLGHATWFMTEYDPETETAFGWSELSAGCGELGYFSLAELKNFTGSYGVKIERDLHFTPKTLAEAVSEFTARYKKTA